MKRPGNGTVFVQNLETIETIETIETDQVFKISNIVVNIPLSTLGPGPDEFYSLFNKHKAAPGSV